MSLFEGAKKFFSRERDQEAQEVETRRVTPEDVRKKANAQVGEMERGLQGYQEGLDSVLSGVRNLEAQRVLRTSLEDARKKFEEGARALRESAELAEKVAVLDRDIQELEGQIEELEAELGETSDEAMAEEGRKLESALLATKERLGGTYKERKAIRAERTTLREQAPEPEEEEWEGVKLGRKTAAPLSRASRATRGTWEKVRDTQHAKFEGFRARREAREKQKGELAGLRDLLGENNRQLTELIGPPAVAAPEAAPAQTRPAAEGPAAQEAGQEEKRQGRGTEGQEDKKTVQETRQTKLERGARFQWQGKVWEYQGKASKDGKTYVKFQEVSTDGASGDIRGMEQQVFLDAYKGKKITLVEKRPEAPAAAAPVEAAPPVAPAESKPAAAAEVLPEAPKSTATAPEAVPVVSGEEERPVQSHRLELRLSEKSNERVQLHEGSRIRIRALPRVEYVVTKIRGGKGIRYRDDSGEEHPMSKKDLRAKLRSDWEIVEESVEESRGRKGKAQDMDIRLTRGGAKSEDKRKAA